MLRIADLSAVLLQMCIRDRYMDDIDFFYEFIADLSDDEQIRFFEETPDFLSDNLNNNETTDLEEDAIYQRIMKKISQL